MYTDTLEWYGRNIQKEDLQVFLAMTLIKLKLAHKDYAKETYYDVWPRTMGI